MSEISQVIIYDGYALKHWRQGLNLKWSERGVC